ncbi:SusC/RagA family TonB-linked outer membrane protein [Acetobacteroides hydrogenigenes]|uniref:TonB-linked SusC/RagA family outer membrane protein n=1 Tax=Acetobacteroides hydrogenigenes TaxID=979970 RepID=A0A4R2ES34_9BACT|nr:SusC/RagA family TonB-linked outer membrane protein [Acetobacteroides hydrogenigenes]TCN70252.1 TonB-linked SusC/RagA family outer membrane protein [Acetobacteroides hydrogenigenes]
MRRFLTLLVTLLVFGAGTALGQGKQVSGKVLSAEDKQPIPGVSVFVKEASTIGTSTSIDGQFTLKNLPANAKTLVFRFVGFQTQEVAIKGGEINVSLIPETQKIDEVVVTAMGMKKSEKTLGYAASTVKSEDLLAGRSASVMSGIAGKVAGVNVSSSGQTGTSQKVIVRGYSSFSENQPLYVVDGVPIQNNFSGSDGSSDAVDFGNQAGDINPDDVESLTVLKGASATALYGSRAANGVIMITTKRSQQDERITVEYNGSFMASDVLRVPQTQNVFGQGWPDWDRMENGSWGPKLDGRMHDWGAPLDANGKFDPKATGREKRFSYVEDNLRNFYETGFETNNTVSVKGGTKNTGFVFSYGNSYANGVIPTDADKYSRNTFSFRGNTKYNNFDINYSINYVRKDMNNVSAGQGDNGATIFPELLQHAVDVDFQDTKDLNNIYNNTDNYYTVYAENPWWVVKNNGNKYQDDRIYGKAEVNYEILKGLRATARLGGDFTNSRQQRWNAIAKRTVGSYAYEGGKKDEVGYYNERNDAWDQIDFTGLLSGNYKLSNDLGFDGVLGYNFNQRSSSFHNSSLSGLVQPNWYSLENGEVMPLSSSGISRRRLIGAFSQMNFDFRNYWFLTLSLRNDWSSTLPKNKNSFFYWGVNTSAILTDMFKSLQNDYVNFIKVRAAYGQTGNDAPAYRTYSAYFPTQIGVGFGDLYLPFAGVLGLTESNRLGNMGLKPEITTELEFGIDARFFKNRLTFDVAYYNKQTKDQIISATVAPETGYTSRTQNIGKIENQGVEANVRIIPVRTSDLEWEVGVTFAKNKSKVKELWAGTDRYRIASGYEIDFMAIVGQPLGQFLAPAELRVAEGEHAGKIVVNSAGRPLVDAGKKDNVGTSQPDFTMGFNTRLTYKGITLSGVFDWRKGGQFWSYTSHIMNFNGNATKTTFNERQPFVIPNSVKQAGVDANGKPIYVENDIPITNYETYNYYNNSKNTPIQKTFVLPKDYLKLREIAVSYSLPKKFFKSGYVKGVSIGVVGRNLFLWTPKDNNFVDPEATNYGNDITSELGEFAAAPTTRNYGGSIKIVF